MGEAFGVSRGLRLEVVELERDLLFGFFELELLEVGEDFQLEHLDLLLELVGILLLSLDGVFGGVADDEGSGSDVAAELGEEACLVLDGVVRLGAFGLLLEGEDVFMDFF